MSGWRGFEPSAEEWVNWAIETEDEAYAALAEQGVTVEGSAATDNAGKPTIALVDSEPSFGVASADDAYLRNEGALRGRIAIFLETGSEGMRRLEYSDETRFSLRDEVRDASVYLDEDHTAPLPFEASRYARTSGECDTLVIIRNFMVDGDEQEVDDKTEYADTEVIIIDAATARLRHIEYLGRCLVEKSPDTGWAQMMRGEAMLYLASLSVDGKPSDAVYRTPHEADLAGQGTIADEDWPDTAYVYEGWLAEGDFGQYNTLAMCVVERDTPIVSQEKLKILTIRLYDLQDGVVIDTLILDDVVIEDSNPEALVVGFAGGQGRLTGNIDYTEFSGVLTLPGAEPVEFKAEAIAAKACPDCGGTGKIDGRPCPRCGGIRMPVYKDGLML